MKTSICLLFSLMLSTVVCAQTSSLVGDFTHGYVEPANEPVWSILNKSGLWSVYRHGDQKTFTATILNEEERQTFWEKMQWPLSTVRQANCLTYDVALICHVPRRTKVKIAWIKKYKSEYFHYDQIGGVMEISLIKGPVNAGAAK